MGKTNFLKSGSGFFMCCGLERGKKKKMLMSVHEGERKGEGQGGDRERERTQAHK